MTVEEVANTGLSGEAGALSVALHALGGGKPPGRFHKMVGAYMLGTTVWQAGKRLWNKANSELTYRVAVPVDDDVYPDVHAWVLQRMSPRQRRSLTARSSRPNTHGILSDSSAATPIEPVLHLFYDGSRSQNVEIRGHTVGVEVEQPGAPGAGSDETAMSSWFKKERILFTTRGVDARDAVLAVLEQLAKERHGRPEPRVFIAARWGDWMRANDRPARHADSVVLRAGQKEALLDDLGAFLRDENEYVQLGIPYHRGYLFHGPPGCGKTSTAQALATEFGLDLYFIPLSSMPNDNTLISLLANIRERCLLLLEDLDIVHGARKRDDGEPGITMGGLLNGLDGIATPHGLVTVMTTNHVEVIDDALIRPGRVDRRELFGPMEDSQLRHLAETVTGHAVTLPPLNGRQVTPADAVGAMKAHIGDPQAMVAALTQLIAGPVRSALCDVDNRGGGVTAHGWHQRRI